MKNQNNATDNSTATGVLLRIAQRILIAHAWVAGPGMTEQQRVQRELVKAETPGGKDAGIAG